MQKRIWNPAFISVCLIAAFMNLGKQMSNSILSKYVDSLGSPATIVGLVSSVFAFSALLFKLISGPALDTYDKEKIVIGATFALGVAFLGYSFSTTVPIIIVFRFLQGAAQAFTATALLTMAADALPKEQFSTGVGTFALFETIATAIGPTIGLGLVRIIGYNSTFLVSSVFMFVSAIGVCFFKQKPFHQTKKFHISLDTILAKESVKYAILLFVFNFSFCVIGTYLAIYAEKQGVVENIGLYFTVYACALLITRPFIGKLTDKLGVTKVLIPAFICFCIAYWLISISTTLWMFLSAAIINAFGLGACQPVVQALCMKCVSQERRGAASSTCYIANDLGNLVGAPVAGWIVETFGYTAMWRAMTIPVIVAGIFVFCIRDRIKQTEKTFVTTAKLPNTF